MKKIRAWIEHARGRKNVEYDDLDKVIQRALKQYGHLFPAYKRNTAGSKTVHHFNAPGIQPISIEKPHGSREFIPRRYAQIIIEGLDDLADYIELNCEEQLNDDTDDGTNIERW
ncbi:MAG: hypothetical protein ACLGSD_02945 [Acidobacteriota bacterium]